VSNYEARAYKALELLIRLETVTRLASLGPGWDQELRDSAKKIREELKKLEA
jgi:hypothetical protein